MSDELNLLTDLPEDVSTHILLKLPFKSFFICACVCKTWNSLIKSPSFLSSHLKQNENNRYLLQLCSSDVRNGFETYCCLLHSKNTKFFDRPKELHCPYRLKFGFQVLGSCNGLILLMQGKYNASSREINLILWNPIIRKSILIENCPRLGFLEAIGLGFDSRTIDYKLLTITEEVGKETTALMVHLYSLKANSWKRLPGIAAVYQKKQSNVHRAMVYLNGALYFVASRGWQRKPRFFISGFDLSDEVFHEIMLPDCIDSNCGRLRFLTSEHFYLSICGESLAILRVSDSDGVLKIWAMMKEQGEKGSWTQLSTVSLETLDDYARCLKISGLVFVDDFRVILSYGSTRAKAGEVFLYDLKSQETKNIRFFEKPSFFLGEYVESLVLLNKRIESRRYIADYLMERLQPSLEEGSTSS